jgi:ABC-type Fe3+-hydroxamate transport system substrate-binding protein
MCSGDEECARELKGKKFDVVLAGSKDVEAAKAKTGASVVPVLVNASKDEVKEAKRTYGEAFDASSGSLRLLPVVNRAAKPAAAGL